jgi:hypothetical protein
MNSSGSGHVPGSCECCNKPLGSIKGGEVFDWLNDYQFLKTLLHTIT